MKGEDMSKAEILDYFDDINHAYNDCGKKDSLSYMLDELDTEIRAKAIDEFAEEIAFGIYESVIWDMLATMSKNGSLSDTSDKIVDYVIETSKKIAEQIKGGATDERNTV